MRRRSKGVTRSPEADPIASARTVRYGERDIVPLRTAVRFTTMIVLPPGEQILDFVCGDKDFWIVNGNQNLAYVKPAKAGARTDLDLVTASGTVYSFLLTEMSGTPGATPDLKVYIEPKDASGVATAGKRPAFVSAQQLEDAREQLDLAKQELTRTQASVAASLTAYRASYPTQLDTAYKFKRDAAPFLVTGIYHDACCTYIQTHATELPALYELKDGAPNLIQFDVKAGVYIVGKILDRGYLTIGKKRLEFSREE